MPRHSNLDWEHFPANDILPEHYSCPYGIVLKTESGKWEAWSTNAAYRPVTSADQMRIETRECISGASCYCRKAIEKLVRPKTMKATA